MGICHSRNEIENINELESEKVKNEQKLTNVGITMEAVDEVLYTEKDEDKIAQENLSRAEKKLSNSGVQLDHAKNNMDEAIAEYKKMAKNS